MRFSFIACLLVAFLAVSCLAKKSANEKLADKYDVCQNVSHGNTAGGWSFMTRSEIKEDSPLARQSWAQAKLVKPDYECKNRETKLPKILVACDQVVNGKNYEYAAVTMIKCDGHGTKPVYYTGKFNSPATGK